MTPGDIRVTWLPPPPELSNGKITKYKVDYCTLKEGEGDTIWGGVVSSAVLTACHVMSCRVEGRRCKAENGGTPFLPKGGEQLSLSLALLLVVAAVPVLGYLTLLRGAFFCDCGGACVPRGVA